MSFSYYSGRYTISRWNTTAKRIIHSNSMTKWNFYYITFSEKWNREYIFHILKYKSKEAKNTNNNNEEKKKQQQNNKNKEKSSKKFA